MRKMILTLATVGALGMLPAPAPADAAVVNDCVIDAVNECNDDFPGDTDHLIAIRGWCYLIRWGICNLM